MKKKGHFTCWIRANRMVDGGQHDEKGVRIAPEGFRHTRVGDNTKSSFFIHNIFGMKTCYNIASILNGFRVLFFFEWATLHKWTLNTWSIKFMGWQTDSNWLLMVYFVIIFTGDIDNGATNWLIVSFGLETAQPFFSNKFSNWFGLILSASVRTRKGGGRGRMRMT